MSPVKGGIKFKSQHATADWTEASKLQSNKELLTNTTIRTQQSEWGLKDGRWFRISSYHLSLSHSQYTLQTQEHRGWCCSLESVSWSRDPDPDHVTGTNERLQGMVALGPVLALGE